MAIPFKKLCELANRQKPSAVKRWCEQRGIFWLPDADGNPTTSEIAYDAAVQRMRTTRPKY